jgi:hypothetical protein
MAVRTDTGWQWPRITARAWGVLFLGCLLLGLWRGATVALEMRAGGSLIPWTRPLLWELTGAVGGWATLFIPLTIALNAPRPAGRWGRFLGLHLAGWLLYWACKSALMLTPRFVLYRAFGWGEYTYSQVPTHLTMEAMKDAISYAAIAAAYLTFLMWRAREAERLRQSQLEAELRDVQLRQLTGQLNPHFLFNALNTVSSLMYEDLARTDALLADLGQLLRAGLERRGPTWTLHEEAEHLRRYCGLLTARFGDRLSLRVELGGVPPDLQVPCFALQGLVENAVKHNQDRPGALSLVVRGETCDGGVRLQVEDDGQGFRDPQAAFGSNGHGLVGLREALRLLHGGAAQLLLGRSAGGGAAVTITLPAVMST